MIAELVEQTYFNESTRVVCPFCSPERRKSNIKDMTLTRKDDGAVVYHCHHCFENGSVQPRKEHKLSAVPSTTVINKQLSLVLIWFPSLPASVRAFFWASVQ